MVDVIVVEDVDVVVVEDVAVLVVVVLLVDVDVVVLVVLVEEVDVDVPVAGLVAQQGGLPTWVRAMTCRMAIRLALLSRGMRLRARPPPKKKREAGLASVGRRWPLETLRRYAVGAVECCGG